MSVLLRRPHGRTCDLFRECFVRLYLVRDRVKLATGADAVWEDVLGSIVVVTLVDLAAEKMRGLWGF